MKKGGDSAPAEAADALAELFATIEETTGLEICIHPSQHTTTLIESGIKHLPHSFSSHTGNFCKTVRANRLGVGCGGYDSHTIVKRSAEVGGPFVNICHAGLGEVVFPIYDYKRKHIITVFIGQAITSEIDEKGFPEILSRVRHLGVDEEKLSSAFRCLPRMSSEQLLRIGRMANLAVKGLDASLDFRMFEHQLMLDQYPAVRKALRLLAESSFDISEGEIARELGLHQSYFSRLFKKVMKCNFQSYVLERRIEQAKVLLYDTKMSIMNIAYSCGFSRQSYFNRRFKSITGMTPSEYRKQ